MKTTKIGSLQGMRAFALLSVILYHFLYRWDSQHPDAHYPSFFGVGHFGVQVFFMISGFVIHISLQNAKSIWDFYFRRVKRLVIPAVVLLPLVMIIAKFSLVDEFSKNARLSNLIPSVFLFDPRYLNVIFHTNLSWVTGVLWTLTIEIWFYLVSGVLFFLFGGRKFLGLLCLFTSAVTFIDHFTRAKTSGVLGLMQNFLDLTGFPHFWWFIIGVIASSIYKKPSMKLAISFTSVCFLTLLFTFNGYRDESEGYSVFLALSYILFSQLILLAVSFRVAIVDSLLGSKLFTYIGDNSYEIYLVHETVGVSLIAYFCSCFHLGTLELSALMVLLSSCMFFVISLFRKYVIKKIEFRLSNLILLKN